MGRWRYALDRLLRRARPTTRTPRVRLVLSDGTTVRLRGAQARPLVDAAAALVGRTHDGKGTLR